MERTLFFREHHSLSRSFGWSGGGGATVVMEDLGADAPATVSRAEFGMCAGHGVRSTWYLLDDGVFA